MAFRFIFYFCSAISFQFSVANEYAFICIFTIFSILFQFIMIILIVLFVSVRFTFRYDMCVNIFNFISKYYMHLNWKTIYFIQLQASINTKPHNYKRHYKSTECHFMYLVSLSSRALYLFFDHKHCHLMWNGLPPDSRSL